MSQAVVFPYFDASLSRVALPTGVCVLDIGIPNATSAKLYAPVQWPLTATELQSRLSAFDAISTTVRGKSEMDILRADASRNETESTSFALRQAIVERSREDEATVVAREALTKAQIVLGLAMHLGQRQKEALASQEKMSSREETLSGLLDSTSRDEATQLAAASTPPIDVDGLEEFEVPLAPTLAAFCLALADGDALLVVEPRAAEVLRGRAKEEGFAQQPTAQLFARLGLSGQAEDFDAFAVKAGLFLPKGVADDKQIELILPRERA